MRWESGPFTGFIDGKAGKTLRMVADPVPTTLEGVAGHPRVRTQGPQTVRRLVRGLGQARSILPFPHHAVTITVDGAARVIGRNVVTLTGGSTGFWLESTGAAGAISLSVSSPRFAAATVTLKAV